MSDSDSQVPNATWLFEGRDPADRGGVLRGEARKGEQWWTSLFALYLLEASRSEPPLPLRVMRVESIESGRRSYKRRQDADIHWENPLDPSDILVETNLRSTDGYRPKGFDNLSMGELFLSAPLPQGFPERFVPDLVVRHGHRVSFFENKAFAGGCAPQLWKYQRACSELCGIERAREAHWYVLISHGNNHPPLWDLIRDGSSNPECPVEPANVILWEDILMGMERIEWIRRVLGDGIDRYYREFHQMFDLEE